MHDLLFVQLSLVAIISIPTCFSSGRDTSQTADPCETSEMAQDAPLTLQKGQAKELAFGSAVRQDWKLLEVDEQLLAEILESGYGFPLICSGGGAAINLTSCSAVFTAQ